MNHQPRAASGVSPDQVAPLSPSAWLRYDIVERTIPAGVRSVLEVGCGRGAFGARIAQRYEYLGLEPDEASFAVARERIAAVGAGEVRRVTTGALGDQRFDLVCAFEVLEHIEDDAAALKDWASRVRPGGWLMLSVPADQHRYGPMDRLVGHFRRYGPRDLAALLEGAGLADVAVRRFNFPLGPVLEAGRNVIGQRKLATATGSVEERTAASGRTLQPGGGVMGSVNRLGTAPFRTMQRIFPGKGTGLIALGHVRG